MPRVYISPSTQGDNRGVGNYGTEESRMNQIADAVVPLLKYNGFTVYRNKPSMSLQQAVADSNTKNVDAHVAIHSNAGGGRGTEVYYKSSSGKSLASDLYKYVQALTPTADRGIKQTDSLYELNNTKATAALIEVAFHDNRDDAKFIINNISSIGEAIAKGICDYFNVKFKKPSSQSTGSQSSKPQNNTSQKPAQSAAGKLYKVQVGAFAQKNNADKLANELKSKGYSAYVYQDNKLYKVQAGAFAGKENAEKLAAELKAKGYNTFVYQD